MSHLTKTVCTLGIPKRFISTAHITLLFTFESKRLVFHIADNNSYNRRKHFRNKYIISLFFSLFISKSHSSHRALRKIKKTALNMSRKIQMNHTLSIPHKFNSQKARLASWSLVSLTLARTKNRGY